jgi:UDP-glucose 6-dehydrogenase
MKLGVVGAGVTGGALAAYFKRVGHEVIVDDPPKGINGNCTDCEAIFICVPAATLLDGRQDLTIIKSVLKKYPKSRAYLRSTVIPKTTDNLRKIMKMAIYAMPEFLTERISNESMEKQGIICGAEKDPREYSIQEEFLEKAFPGKQIILMTNREAELAKYAHNVMGALKVNFFNLVHKYAERIHADFDNVLEGVLMSGYIDPSHTKVPGPDGKYGFGGHCFPKDTAAFIEEAKRIGLQVGSLQCMMVENFLYRTQRGQDLPHPKISYTDNKKQPIGFSYTIPIEE